MWKVLWNCWYSKVNVQIPMQGQSYWCEMMWPDSPRECTAHSWINSLSVCKSQLSLIWIWLSTILSLMAYQSERMFSLLTAICMNSWFVFPSGCRRFLASVTAEMGWLGLDEAVLLICFCRFYWQTMIYGSIGWRCSTNALLISLDFD